MGITYIDILIYIALAYMILSAIIQFIIFKKKNKYKPLKIVFIFIGLAIDASLIYGYVKEPQFSILCFIMMCSVDIFSWSDFYINKIK